MKHSIRPNPNGGTYWGAIERLVDLYDQSPPVWVTSKSMKQIARIRQLDKFVLVIRPLALQVR